MTSAPERPRATALRPRGNRRSPGSRLGPDGFRWVPPATSRSLLTGSGWCSCAHRAGTTPSTSLWVYYLATGAEREVAGARQILGEGEEHLPEEERARRERSRELAGGITAYACDDAVQTGGVRSEREALVGGPRRRRQPRRR